MKIKVWVLEKFETREELEKGLSEAKAIAEDITASGTEEQKKTAAELVQAWEKRIAENPDGHWMGWEGKSDYRQFCYRAKDAIRRADKGTQFRVVEGAIEEDAKYWLGYEVVKVNDGVLKYLMATK